MAGADDTDGSNDGDDGFIIVCSVIAINPYPSKVNKKVICGAGHGRLSKPNENFVHFWEVSS